MKNLKIGIYVLFLSLVAAAQTELDEEYYEREEEIILDDMDRAMDSGSLDAIEEVDERAKRLDEDKKRDKEYSD